MIRIISSAMARFAVLAGSVLLPAGLFAQSGAGSIQGTIQDASAAAIAGCSVHVVNQSTGVANDTTSNSSGFYSVPGLFAGNYTADVQCAGNEEVPDRDRASGRAGCWS